MGRQAGQVMDLQSTPVVSVASQALSPWAPSTPHMMAPCLDTFSVMEDFLCLEASQSIPAGPGFLFIDLSPTVKSDIFLRVESIIVFMFLVVWPLHDDPGLCPDSDTAVWGAAGATLSPVFCRGR